MLHLSVGKVRQLANDSLLAAPGLMNQPHLPSVAVCLLGLLFDPRAVV